VRLASGPGSRAVKYRHLFDEALGLSGPEISLLTVLMLRGAQTPGELKGRSERLHAFGSLADLHETLENLIARELVERQERQPGQKEERYRQLLGGGASAAPEPEAAPVAAAAQDDRLEALEARVDRLEDELESLRRAVSARE
jgi:uncharacterized protein